MTRLVRSGERRWLTAPALAGCLVFAPAPHASADERSATFRLAWVRGEGADGCVDERDLEAGVRARLRRDPFSPDAAQSIEGDITGAGGSFRAKLRVRDRTGARVGLRELDVTASDCKKLTDAIVLAVALVIDPRTSPQQSLAEPSAPPPPADDAKSSPELPAPSSSVPAPCLPPPCPPERACPVQRAPECPAAPAHFGARASVRALGAAGILPDLAPGVGVSAALGVSRFRFTAGMSYFPEQGHGDFAFGLSTVNVGACASANPLGPATPSLCAQLQAGAMHAVVRELQPLEPGDHVWAAAALGPEVSVRPLAPLFVEVSVQGVLPLLRPRFAVRGDSGTVFESAWLGAIASVGVGIIVP